MNTPSSLNLFHPLIRKWFIDSYKEPTEIQEKAWKEIAKGSHVLITAPTGSGKTLAAFLWALNNLISHTWPAGSMSVLYISPLKALNVDVQRNLLTPLQELSFIADQKGNNFHLPRVLTRSGDTPQKERQKMQRLPPEILITTPESLNLMLSSLKTRKLFASLHTVIMDEVHAISSNKRGVHMITAVERLTRLSGEFQRIALSATVRPLESVADFIGGYRLYHEGDMRVYKKRKVVIISSRRKKAYHMAVDFPQDARDTLVDGSWWPTLIRAFRQRIRNNRSTLIFTNTRRHAEKITRLLNEADNDILAYAHHGSLSKEVRSLVERKLKAGELRAIVATSSLELGIDIGTLDEVILVETPPSVWSGLQRIGRSGHRVHDITRGTIYPIHGRDFLEAAVMTRLILSGNIEDSHPVLCALDVLAQFIISMTCMEQWNREELFHFIKTSYPYHTLSKRHFDIVVDMLAGKYEGTRIRELKPRITVDGIDKVIRGKKGSIFLLYLSGGTIADRGYFDLRVSGTGTKIGDLDEEFVWERRIGDVFTMGTQTWEIVGIDQQKVEVISSGAVSRALPFWKAEQRNRDFHFSEQLASFCEEWNTRVESQEFEKTLCTEYCMSPPAAAELISFLKRQKEATGSELPHRHHLIIEHFSDNAYAEEVKRIFIHTIWGGKVNLPFALALSAAWEKAYHYPLEVFIDNFCVMLLLPHDFNIRDILYLVKPHAIEQLLRERLESTGFFGALFRENAGRALLLPGQGFGKRLPLWLTRLRSKKLFEAILRFKDFPVLIETWRHCMHDEFDLPHLKMLLEELACGKIRYTEVETVTPSPLATGLIWRQTDKHMYEDDVPGSGKRSGLDHDLLRDVYASASLRPRLKKEVIEEFMIKTQRTYPGYVPMNSCELLDWIKERLLIPHDEWENLLKAIVRENQTDIVRLLSEINEKIVRIRLPGAVTDAVVAIESLPRILTSLDIENPDIAISPAATHMIFRKHDVIGLIQHLLDESRGKGVEEEEIPAIDRLAGLIGEWLRYYGPVKPPFICSVFGIHAEQVQQVLSFLSEDGTIIIDELIQGEKDTGLCDSENVELLLRLMRKRSRPSFTPLPTDFLPLFYATWHDLRSSGNQEERLKTSFEQLFGYPAPARLWETEIFPARLPSYSPLLLDRLFRESGLLWFGCGNGCISFAFAEDLELFNEQGVFPCPDHNQSLAFFPDMSGKYNFWDLCDHSGMDSAAFTTLLWENVWKGVLSNESFEVIRKGIHTGFRPEGVSKGKSRSLSAGSHRFRKVSYNRWKSSRPGDGAWFALPPLKEQTDMLYRQELQKERIRQLLSRYGILVKKMLDNELPVNQWSPLFRTLRLMELSGEIIGGLFFEGIEGPHFTTPEAFQLLKDGLDERKLYWMNACDPVSPCGQRMKSVFPHMPQRLPTTHIIFRGTVPILISRKSGKELEFRVQPDSPHIHMCIDFFSAMLDRKVMPWKSVRVESINGREPGTSPYSPVLETDGFSKDFRRLILRGGY